MEGFLHYEFGGLIFGGAYTWRGLFSEFYGMSLQLGKLHGHLLDGSGPRQNVKSTTIVRHACNGPE